MPVDWTDIAGSKVSLLSDSIRMFAALRSIRARMRDLEKRSGNQTLYASGSGKAR